MAYNIWNHEDIEHYLRSFAGVDHAQRMGDLMVLALGNVLKKHSACLHNSETYPEGSAPAWLTREKWEDAAPWHHFQPNAALDGAVKHIADFIKAALVREAAWVQEERPSKLANIGSLEAATHIADKAMMKKSFDQAGLDPAVGTEIIMDFGDGWLIRKLNTRDALRFDGAQLHHCVANGAYDDLATDIYSLRYIEEGENAVREKPIATLEVRDNMLEQCKGLQNQPPGEAVFPYIEQFVKSKNLGLSESAKNTGLISWRGTIYSLYDLPEGIEIKDDLDLSRLKILPKLPSNMLIERSLVLPSPYLKEGDVFADVIARMQDRFVLPEDMNVQHIEFSVFYKGKHHNAFGPAYLSFDGNSKIATSERWYINGRFHREDGPAVIYRDAQTGHVILEAWYINSRLHREDGPAVIYRDAQTGVVTEEVWRINDRYYREDGPAFIERDAQTGVVTHENWYIKYEHISQPSIDARTAEAYAAYHAKEQEATLTPGMG